MYPKCILPGFTDQIHNISLMRPIGRIHAGYILNIPHLSNVIGLGSKCVRSMKLGTLRSHDWVHSKSDQHVSQEQIKITFMGTFPMYPLFAHWAHWGYLLSVPAMCSACAQQVNDPLSPVIGTKVYTGLLGVVSIPVPDVVAILAHEPALVKWFLLEVQPLDEPMSLKDPILHLDLGPQPRNQCRDHRIGD